MVVSSQTKCRDSLRYFVVEWYASGNAARDGVKGDADVTTEASAPSPATATWRSNEFVKGGPILFTAVLGAAVGLSGLQTYSLPFFIAPLVDEFGWSRSEISLAVSAKALGLLLALPVFGRLCDRFGVRRVAPFSIIALAISLSLSAFATAPYHLYLCYGIGAFLGAGTGYAIYSRAVGAWFDKSRGLALGITMSGTGLSAALIPLYVPFVIEQFGWRGAYFTLAAVALLALVPVLLLMRDNPDGSAAKSTRGAGHSGGSVSKSLGEAMRTRQFWLIWVGILLLSITIVGLHIHFIGVFSEAGIDATQAAYLASLYGLSVLISRIAIGFLVDRVHAPFVAATVFTVTGCGCLLFAFLGAPVAPLLAIMLGVSAGSEGDLIGYLTSRYFGMTSYSEIFSWLFSALVIGVAVGPVLVGLSRDMFQSYEPALMTGAGLAVLVGVMFALLGPFPEGEAEH